MLLAGRSRYGHGGAVMNGFARSSPPAARGEGRVLFGLMQFVRSVVVVMTPAPREAN